MDTLSDPTIIEEEAAPPEATTGDEGLDAAPPEEELSEGEPEEVDTEPRLRVPRAVVWSIVALLSLACVSLFLLGLAQSTWDIGGIVYRVNLGGCLQVMRNQLAAANAPEEALQRLTDAAYPGIWSTDAYNQLREAERILAPLENDPQIAPALKDLRAMLPSNQYGILSCSDQRYQSEQISPTLHSIP